MEPFVAHTGLVVPLDQTNINTDDIAPARFLKTIKRAGFADTLFANWRYLGDSRMPNPDFVLNQSRYRGGSILLANDNFGCGSSREHAPWSIREYGFRSIIAPSFADIFYNNCFNNGILPIILGKVIVEELFHEVITQDGYILSIDLSEQRVKTPSQRELHFEIDQFRKNSLLKGLDNIGWTLSHKDEILTYENQRRQESPWLFDAAYAQRVRSELRTQKRIRETMNTEVTTTHFPHEISYSSAQEESPC